MCVGRRRAVGGAQVEFCASVIREGRGGNKGHFSALLAPSFPLPARISIFFFLLQYLSLPRLLTSNSSDP